MLMNISMGTNNEDDMTRHYAATLLKQEVQKNYTSQSPIPEQDKAYLRDVIINAVTASVVNNKKLIRKMMEDVLFKMVLTDFPINWPNMLNNVIGQLNGAQQVNETYGAL